MKIKGHLPALDGLRGLAILLVMLHHFKIIEPHSSFEYWFFKGIDLGRYGVDLFFVLSGFLITGILLDSKDNPHYFRNFYMRRILRIFPLYYAFILATLFILPGLLSHIPAAKEKLADFSAAREHWPWYVFYLSNFWVAKKNFFAHGGIDITWSLAIEEHFYLVWPFIISRLDRKSVPKFCLFIIGLAVATRALMCFSGATIIQVYVVTFSRMDSIALGSLIAAWARLGGNPLEQIKRFSRPRHLLISLTALAVLFVAEQFLETERHFFDIPKYLTVGFFFSHLLIVVLNAAPVDITQKIFTHPFLVFLGKYSYALYFFHIPVKAVICDLLLGSRPLESFPGPAILWQFGFYPAALLLVIPLALLSWNVIEKPMLDLKRFFPSSIPSPKAESPQQSKNKRT